MYEAYYQLSGQPFRLSPDHRFFFGSQAHRKAMSYLKYGLGQGEGFIVITGPVGTGKSTLVSQLLAELQQSRILAAQIATTQIEADDAIRLILSAFNILPPGQDKATLLRAFEQFLVQQYRAGRRVLLVIDEAQNLPMRTLEELRMLSNFSVDGQSLFQSFLLGQPQFNGLLASPELEQLRQRVIASYQLEPMNAADTRAYIEHRLRLVGWAGRPSFDPGVFEAIHAETNGVARRINTVCSRLLLFGAIEERDHLDEAAARSVIADLKGELAESLPAGAPARAAGAAPAADPATAERLSELESTVLNHQRALHALAESAIGLLSTGLGQGGRRNRAVVGNAAE